MSEDALVGIYFLIGSMVYFYYVGKKDPPLELAILGSLIFVPIWPIFLAWQLGVERQYK